MEQNKFRCHFSIILENLGSGFWILCCILISSVDNFSEIIILLQSGKANALEILGGLGIVLAVFCLILIYNWVVWAKTWISIDKDAIVIERNLLNRKVNTIGMKNISNINIEQNLFERIIGTCKIKLDTNSATTANTTDVKIVLSKSKAEYFKQQVMLCMDEEQEEVQPNVMDYDVEYKAKDIILHCVYTASPIAVLFCLAFIIGCAVALNSVNTGTVVLDGIINILGSLLAVILIVGSVFQSLVRDFFVYYGFKARRHENKIYLTHGFFKKRQYTIAVDKINALKMEAPIVSRILGRQFVKVICVGVGDENNENSMILLSEKTEDMKRKLSVLLPEFVVQQPEIIRRNRNSIWSAIMGCIINMIIWGAMAIVFGIVNILEIETMWIRIGIIVVCILVVLLVGIAEYLNIKTCGIGLGQNTLLIVMGNYGKRSTWIPYSKIQELQYEQGPIARRFGYAMGNIYILAAAMDSFHITSYFGLEVFDQIHERMLKRKGKQ